MIRYLIPRRDRIFVKGCWFLSFAKNKGKNIGKNTSKNLSTKYDQKSNMRTYDNIQKITTRQRDDYRTGCLLDCDYFSRHYKLIAIDSSEQQALDADPKAIQQINFTGNLDQDNSATMFLITEEA